MNLGAYECSGKSLQAVGRRRFFKILLSHAISFTLDEDDHNGRLIRHPRQRLFYVPNHQTYDSTQPGAKSVHHDCSRHLSQQLRENVSAYVKARFARDRVSAQAARSSVLAHSACH
eukprot:CAMPEP_0184383046 /NCGR_PEP_ID=MMETSP0007-20130409/6825_1 /TAXON_ID=97485 /ORGANISM="Prymnesium parvum, Strain Texoma1" /LENGTH=115 /DNA_ID=CAMNT_0026729355 /DNA_START=155 /DNA_END=502 /DNA_ORIENTATION=+